MGGQGWRLVEMCWEGGLVSGEECPPIYSLYYKELENFEKLYIFYAIGGTDWLCIISILEGTGILCIFSIIQGTWKFWEIIYILCNRVNWLIWQIIYISCNRRNWFIMYNYYIRRNWNLMNILCITRKFKIIINYLYFVQ